MKNKKILWFIIVLILITTFGITYTLYRSGDLNVSLSGTFKKKAPPIILNLSSIEDEYTITPYDNDSVLKYLGFHLSYNEEFEQSTWTAYILTSEMVSGGFVERTNNFRSDTNITTMSASLADYRKSGYDRGHLVPAGDMKWSKTAMSESFLLSNMSPQVPGFNRNIWKKLESKVRDWTIAYDSVYVVTGPVLTNIDQFIGNNQVGVPKYFFKVIVDISFPTYKGIAFLIENKASGDDVFRYAITIYSLEKYLDYDFFPGQDPYSITMIESSLDLAEWK